MHIPDGFLDAKTWISLSVISAAVVGIAVKIINKSGKNDTEENEKSIPLMGVMAAFIFATQMLNFPVMPGISGHFMGAALAAILLGPFTALLIMTTVLILQCLVFQDGGLTALGANIFNMGIAGGFFSYLVYLFLRKIGFKNILIPAFISSWFAIVLASSFCAIELAVSNTISLNIALPAMAGIHALIGIGEGIITISVLSFLKKVRPDLLDLKKI